MARGRCSEWDRGCRKFVRLTRGQKSKRCRECRELAARIDALHSPGRMPTEAELAAEREARMTVRVGC